MEKISIPSYSYTAKSYCLLAKPGIILGNAITTAGGFALASKGHIDFFLFLATMIGLSCVIGSACAFNNYIDRESDVKMSRTKNRPLARGDISVKNALMFALALGAIGVAVLGMFTNLRTLSIAIFGFLAYVILYSFSKYRSVHGTLIGSIAGAVPPVIGYCAVSNKLDAPAWILFAIIVMWQMPHFFAIAIYRMDDYAKAGIPVLPVQKGIVRTKVQMVLYIIGFIAASSLLPLFDYTGNGYFFIVLLLGAAWLLLALQGFKSANDVRWARKMFVFSLVIVTAQFASIPFSIGH
ncbi:MAG: protoheme IX farnesyltransferase [Verrucomicrobia bacterium]|nr:protoheme IX farnesyltransferase [Verrucomicrobiota bacterium]